MSQRYRILSALWLFQTVNYIDRVSLSFAGPTISKSLGLDAAGFGIVLSSFAVGYFIAQLPGGLLADRRGTRAVLIAMPLAWATIIACHSLVTGTGGFIAVRACLGIAEGLANAACLKAIGDAFSSRERARASAWWSTSFAIAPAIAAPLITTLIIAVGWKAMFLWLAPLAIITALINVLVLPKAEPLVSAAPSGPTFGAGAAAMLRQPTLWLLLLTYFAYNIGYWGYVGWMPTYLASAHGIDIKNLGLLGSIPYAFGVAGLLLGGWLGSGPLYRFRPQLLAASYVVAAAALTIAFEADRLPSTMAGLSLAAFCLFGGLGLFSAIVLEFAPVERRGTYAGIVATAGQMGGIIAPALIGHLVTQSGSFATGFALMIGAFVVAAVTMLVLAASANRWLERRTARPVHSR